MKEFVLNEMQRFAHELSLSPMRHRLRQARGIVRALELVEPEHEYPFSFVCFHITGYRPRRGTDSVLDGADLRADLAALLDQLTAASPIPPQAAGGPLYDPETLARRFNVSTKTITRWRAKGLVGAWYQDAGGRARLAFASHSVEHFVAHHTALVRRGSAFAQLTESQRTNIIRRARELVAEKKRSLHAATLIIAEETGRAVETIRYTLRRFDRDHPDQAIFEQNESAEPQDEADEIYEAHRTGTTPAELARRFGRSRATIERMLHQARAAQLAAKPIEYVYHESFDAVNADEFVPPAAARAANGPDETLSRRPADLPPYLEHLYRTPLLERAEEAALFHRMNYELHRAETARRKLADCDGDADAIRAEVQARLDAAGAIKNRIVQANLRLVVSIAKRHVFGHPALNLFELISDGNVALIRAVEKFDFARGFRFSTFATWVVTRSFARSVPDELTQLERFQTGRDAALTTAGRAAEPAESAENPEEQIRAAISSTLRLLDPRERAIVERHFGLAGRVVALTLEQIGQELGLSKERVRQIERRALAKIREELGDRGTELLTG